MQIRTMAFCLAAALASGLWAEEPAKADKDAFAEPPEVANPVLTTMQDLDNSVQEFAEVKSLQLSAFTRVTQFTLTARDLVNSTSTRIASNLVPGFSLAGAYHLAPQWYLTANFLADYVRVEAPSGKTFTNPSSWQWTAKVGAMLFTDQNFYAAGDLVLGQQLLVLGRSATDMGFDRFASPGLALRAGYWWAPEDQLTIRPEVSVVGYFSQGRSTYQFNHGFSYSASVTALFALDETVAIRGGFIWANHSSDASAFSQSRTDYSFEAGVTFNGDWL